jgi:hypothetical protein
MGLAIAAVVKGCKCVFKTIDKQSKEKIAAACLLETSGASKLTEAPFSDPSPKARPELILAAIADVETT